MKSRFLSFLLLLFSLPCFAEYYGELHVDGRYLCDSKGNHVLLHGFGQTYSPWFNEEGKGWGWELIPSKCLSYNQGLIDKIVAAGWKMDWLRLHMDPVWSNDDVKVAEWKQKYNETNYPESAIYAFSETRFKKYLDEVFIPMAEYASGKDMYVVMRPPGVCPENISVGDDYYNYLMKVWKIVCSHAKLKNNAHIMFELANEPIKMNDGSGNYTADSDGSQKKCTEFFQNIVDAIRALGCNNILWVPGLAYQQNYQGYAKYPIKGNNIGYAVHCYPGWYGSDSEVASAEQQVVTNGAGYMEFYNGWTKSIGEVSQKNPILVTEMDWAPKKYNSSWGKATTGKLGGVGFGANFKYLMDLTGNVSWMLFTGPEHLAKYDDKVADGSTFLSDPEACVRPIYRWYKEYKDPNWKFDESIHQHILDSIKAESANQIYKAFDFDAFDPNIFEKGTTFVTGSGSHCIVTGQYGFGGWKYKNSLDFSGYKYLVVKLASAPTSGGWSFRIFDNSSYWSDPYMVELTGKTQVVVTLNNMVNDKSRKLDSSTIFIVGFWSYGSANLYVDKIYLTNSDTYEETGIGAIEEENNKEIQIFDLNGRKTNTLQKGNIYFLNGRKVLVK